MVSLVGRPTSYDPRYVDKVYKLCLLGATNEEIAEIINISIDTLYEWKNKHPEFSDSLERGRHDADANVANRLYQRAMGYSHKAVKIFMPAGAEEPVYAEYTEHYPPDTQAASLWLRNRQPARWRDRQELTGAGGRDLIPARQADLHLTTQAVQMLIEGVVASPAAAEPQLPRTRAPIGNSIDEDEDDGGQS
jgi:hypothetical protein